MLILIIALLLIALLITAFEIMNYSHNKTMLKYIQALDKVNPRGLDHD